MREVRVYGDWHEDHVRKNHIDDLDNSLSADVQFSNGGAKPRVTRTLALAETRTAPGLIEFPELHVRSSSRAVQLACKRAFDVFGAICGLLLLSPLLLAIAAMIKLGSRGPVFFRQQRTGLDQQPFEILKFRSMYTDRCDISGVAQTVRDDPRVTPIGRMLRRTNLDELPQLINVLKGDMSLVGPRPHVPGMLAAGILYEDLVPGYARRHTMRPGITGLAQVNGLRGPTTERGPAVDRVRYDLEYVRTFSLWLDVKILLRTVASELRGGTGY